MGWLPYQLVSRISEPSTVGILYIISCWWFQPQPISRIWVKMGSSSPNRSENKTYLKPPSSQKYLKPEGHFGIRKFIPILNSKQGPFDRHPYKISMCIPHFFHPQQHPTSKERFVQIADPLCQGLLGKLIGTGGRSKQCSRHDTKHAPWQCHVANFKKPSVPFFWATVAGFRGKVDGN